MIARAWTAFVSLIKQIGSAVYKHYINVIAGFVILAITNIASFLFGLSSADTIELVAKQNSFGAHCPGQLVRLNQEKTPGFTIASPSLETALVCGGATKMTGTAEEALLQYVGRFRKCFQYDKKDKSLSFYQETDTRLQLFTNEDQVEVAACNCAEGQAKLIATHNTGSGKWCGSKAPDPAKM